MEFSALVSEVHGFSTYMAAPALSLAGFCTRVLSLGRAVLFLADLRFLIMSENPCKRCCVESFAFIERRSFANQEKGSMRPYVRQEKTSWVFCPMERIREDVCVDALLNSVPCEKGFFFDFFSRLLACHYLPTIGNKS